MKKKRPGLFACVGLDLLGHPRANAAGEAMLTWFYALLHTRKHHLDGFISDVDVENLPKPSNKIAFAEKLAGKSVGLFARVDGGWMVLRYEEWNETAADIAERRTATKERVANHRRNITSNTPGNANVTPYVTPSVTQISRISNPFVPVSDSGDLNSSEKSLETSLSGGEQAGPVTVSQEQGRGFFGLEEGWWREGVAESTGVPCGPISWAKRAEFQDAARAVFGALDAHAAEREIRASGKAYADTLKPGQPLHVANYVAWLRAGNFRPRALRSVVKPDVDAPPLPRPEMDDDAMRDAGNVVLAALERA